MANYIQADRSITMVTPLGPDVLLPVGLSGHEAVSRLFDFQLDLIAENDVAIPFDELLGQKVTIQMTSADGRRRPINGICSRLSQGIRGHTFTAYHAEVVPQLWFLTKRAQSRVFQRATVPEILARVFEGLDVAFEIRGTFHPRDYCAQYRETDFDFASRLMEEEGIFYYFRHTAGGHTMIVADTPRGHPAVPGQERALYDEIAGGLRTEDHITSWEKTQELCSGKFTLRDYSFELHDRTLEAAEAIRDGVQAGRSVHTLGIDRDGKLEVYDWPGGGRHSTGVDPGGGDRPDDLLRLFEDNRRTAAVRMEQEAVRGLVIRGAGNCRQFAPGYRFTLERHFDADGPYLVTEVRHTCRVASGYRSGMEALDYRNEFTCIPLELPFRPQRTTPRPVARGPQTAVVVGPPGEEIFTDKYGRVKVRFHWDRRGAGDADSSCWIRVAQAAAGGGFGTIFIPRVGQEVVVQFEEGDPDRPLITGSVYNPGQMPPFTLPAGRMISGLRSNTYPGGGGMNEISLDDSKGRERMFLHAQHDQDTVVGHDRTAGVGHDATDRVGRDVAATVGRDKSEAIGRDSALVVTGTHAEQAREIALSASSKVTITCGGSSIVLEPDQITMKSPLVKINC
jgi:type VI secretion system secreted protein VgrG